jgi:hypothetical protein
MENVDWIKLLVALVKEQPNDAGLGKEVRSIVLEYKKNQEKIKVEKNNS